MDYSGIANIFEGDNPTGVNLRNDDSLIRQYHAIRDARSAARAEDRSLENQMVPDGSDRPADEIQQPSARWGDVRRLTVDALTNQTKDIELFAWLAESVVRVDGIAALGEVLRALDTLVGEHFEALHSSYDDTLADKVIPLSGLNGSPESDGTLIRPMRLLSLAPNEIYGRLSLWGLERARKSKDPTHMAAFQQAFASVDGAAFVAQRDAVASCLASVEGLDRKLTDKCGADAPSFSRVKDVLGDIRSAYVELAAFVKLPAGATAEGVVEAAVAPAANGAAAPAAAVSGEIADREQAFRTLLRVAEFFRRTEPHSSLSFAIETLVRRGRMDFMELIGELLPDENQRRDMLTRAGIRPAPPS